MPGLRRRNRVIATDPIQGSAYPAALTDFAFSLDTLDCVYIGTWGLSFWQSGSPLGNFLEMLSHTAKRLEILVGYGDARGLTQIAAHYWRFKKPNFELRVRTSFHSKYVIFTGGKQVRGLIGSHNFTDSGYENISVEMGLVHTKRLVQLHAKAWAFSRSLPETLARFRRTDLDLIAMDYTSPFATQEITPPKTLPNVRTIKRM